MTIRELFYKYRDAGLQGRSIEVSYDNTLDIKDIIKYQNVIFTEMPQDPDDIVDIILRVFIEAKSGISLYIEDLPNAFIDLLEQRYRNDGFLVNDRKYGITVQHIYGVGYIISLAKCSPLFMVNHFTLDEYDRLSNEYIVVGMAKSEKHYIKDWVAYHLHIGFDKIYLFDNNDDPNEIYDGILSEYINDGRVNIINFRDKVGVQTSTYNAFYYSFPFKWAAIIDIDEFIWFDETYKYNNIKDFLQNICQDAGRFGVMLQWHCYAASGEDKPSDKPIWEANNTLLPFNARKNCRPEYIHNWCKSIYKSGYRLEMNEHFGWEPDMRPDINLIYINENDYEDRPIVKENLIYITEDEFNSQGVYVKHFLLRNIDDFYFRKYLRGHAGGEFCTGSDGWAFWQWRQNLNYYTDIQDILSAEEQLYLKKHGMKMNYTFHPDVIVNWCILEGNDYINGAINKIITNNILSISNCLLNQITITDITNRQESDNEMIESLRSTYDFDFLSRHIDNGFYFDVMMGGDRKIVRKNIQDPVIINIGIPIKYATQQVSIEEQKQYAGFLWEVFSKDRCRQYLRDAIDHGITTIPAIGIEDNNPDCKGYRESLEVFLKNNNLEVPNQVLSNNTLIMPFSQYLKLCDFQDKFTGFYGWWTNNDICDNARGRYNTPYHAYICSVMSIMDNVQIMEP